MKHNIVVFAVLLIFLCSESISVYACDSTLLAILAGEDSKKRVQTQLLAVTQKLQIEGSLLNSFNVAAAKKMHGQVMENWLQIASEITVNPPVSGKFKVDFSCLLIDISKQFGKIRRLLMIEGNPFIHEVIEACITKVSVLGALISDNQVMLKFLDIELALYEPRVWFGQLNVVKKKTSDVDLNALFEPFASVISIESLILELKDRYKKFRSLLYSDVNNVSEATLREYQLCLNCFVKIKQKLLEEKFFE